jgi:hypothetical protein
MSGTCFKLSWNSRLKLYFPVNLKRVIVFSSIVLCFRFIKPHKPEVYENNIWEFSSCLAEDILRLHYKDQLVHSVQENNRRLLWESYDTHNHNLWGKNAHILNVKIGGFREMCYLRLYIYPEAGVSTSLRNVCTFIKLHSGTFLRTVIVIVTAVRTLYLTNPAFRLVRLWFKLPV